MIWIFAAVLWAGILTMRIETRWALTVFETALFALAAIVTARRRFLAGLHPIGVILAAISVWGLLQAGFGISVDAQKTLEASLHSSANCAAFCLGVALSNEARTRRRFLTAQLIFALLLAVGAVIGLFTIGSLGPFAYRNQFAAFLEPAVGLAMAAAMADEKRSVAWLSMAGALLAAVVAGGSRTGSALCLALLIVVPVAAYFKGAISAGRLTRVTLVGLAAAGALVAVVGWQTILERFEEPHPFSLRAKLNHSSFEMFRDRPLTGFGLGTWPSAYPKYASYDDGTFVNQAHDDWAQWAVEGGAPMLFAMFAIVAILAPRAWRSLWGMGLLAVFVHAAVDYPFEQRPALAAYFFALMGVLPEE